MEYDVFFIVSPCMFAWFETAAKISCETYAKAVEFWIEPVTSWTNFSLNSEGILGCDWNICLSDALKFESSPLKDEKRKSLGLQIYQTLASGYVR